MASVAELNSDGSRLSALIPYSPAHSEATPYHERVASAMNAAKSTCLHKLSILSMWLFETKNKKPSKFCLCSDIRYCHVF